MNRRTFFAASAGAIAGAALPAIPVCQHVIGPQHVCEKCGITAESLYFSGEKGPVTVTYRSYSFVAKRGEIRSFKTPNGMAFTISMLS